MLDPCTGEAQAADLGYVVGCTGREARSRRGLGTSFQPCFTRRSSKASIASLWTELSSSIARVLSALHSGLLTRTTIAPVDLGCLAS
jgi:hypothetical protein